MGGVGDKYQVCTQLSVHSWQAPLRLSFQLKVVWYDNSLQMENFHFHHIQTTNCLLRFSQIFQHTCGWISYHIEIVRCGCISFHMEGNHTIWIPYFRSWKDFLPRTWISYHIPGFPTTYLFFLPHTLVGLDVAVPGHSGLKWEVRWGVSQIWPKTQF